MDTSPKRTLLADLGTSWTLEVNFRTIDGLYGVGLFGHISCSKNKKQHKHFKILAKRSIGECMLLSIVIPARNEDGCVRTTVEALYAELKKERIHHEIIVVDDNSTDNTREVLLETRQSIPTLNYVVNHGPNGFGFAIRKGLEVFKGDVVAIYMADNSDSPKDLVLFYRTMLEKNVDCVFGTRWSNGGRVIDYPILKLILNRLANAFIQVIFNIHYNDVTNAFKLFRRHVVIGLEPFLSQHFNLTVELPLKAIVRGYTYAIVPNDWTNRKFGISKLKIKEMGSRYLFIVLYCFLEKWLSRGDYHRAALGKQIQNPAHVPTVILDSQDVPAKDKAA
jgi:dolichol-phosphate mannosyltransferase